MASESSKSGKKTSVSRKQTKSAEPSLNIDEIREIADLVDERGFTDFEFENEKIRIRLSKTQPIISAPPPMMPSAQPVQHSETPVQTAVPTASSEKTNEEDATEADDGLHKITSPIVGTFYRSPSPDKPPYVKEGDTVSDDSVVCIVEAMKLMNEIQAETAGEVVKIYVENAQPVEFGQPLFGIRK